jgi:hypothetical protein
MKRTGIEMLEALGVMDDDANDIPCCSLCRTCNRERQNTAYISKFGTDL